MSPHCRRPLDAALTGIALGSHFSCTPILPRARGGGEGNRRPRS